MASNLSREKTQWRVTDRPCREIVVGCKRTNSARWRSKRANLRKEMETIMKQPRVIKASGCLAALLVAGCGGGGVSPNSTANLPGVAAPSGGAERSARHRAKSCRTTECIYVAVLPSYSATGSVNVYPASADGDVAPIWTISGLKTKDPRIANLAVDAARNVYVVDYVSTNDSILVYAAGAHGNVAPIRTISGSNTGLSYAWDIAVDPHGLTYVVNNAGGYGQCSITVYAAGANGNVAPIQTISGPQTTLSFPTGIAVDAQGNIYVQNHNEDDILVFAPGASGDVAPARTIRSQWMSNPGAGIAVNAKGAIYIGNSPQCGYYGCYGASVVLRFPPGANGYVADVKTLTGPKTQLNNPDAIALGPGGRIYVTDVGDHSIFVYAAGAHGNVAPLQTIAGSNTGFDNYPGPAGIDVR